MASIDVAALSAAYSDDIARIDRMLLNVLTINTVEMIYHELTDWKFEPTIDSLMKIEALQTAMVVSYGRLFSASKRTTQIQAKHIPEHLRSAHSQIIEMRHQRYAHHGGHPSITTSAKLEAREEGVLVDMRMQIGFYVGAPPSWAPLFVWAREHIATKVDDDLAYLSRKSGLQWFMEKGPPPKWAVE